MTEKMGFRDAWKATMAHQREEREKKEKARRVMVVRYKNAKEFERDAEKQIAAGWVIQAQSQETGQTHRVRRAGNGALIGGLFMMPGLGAAIGAFTGKREEGPITVTWVRNPDA